MDIRIWAIMILLMIYFTVSVGCMASNKPDANRTKNLLAIYDFLDYALIVTLVVHVIYIPHQLTLQNPDYFYITLTAGYTLVILIYMTTLKKLNLSEDAIKYVLKYALFSICFASLPILTKAIYLAV